MSERRARWAVAVASKLAEVRALPTGWDGYRGIATRNDVAIFVLRLLGAIARPDTPAPSLVPLPSGGLQLEWHTDTADIELKVVAPFSVEAWVCDPQVDDDEGETRSLSLDYTYLDPWIKKLG
jgi:hypothetical protein